MVLYTNHIIGYVHFTIATHFSLMNAVDCIPRVLILHYVASSATGIKCRTRPSSSASLSSLQDNGQECTDPYGIRIDLKRQLKKKES